jgi:hypothetical protein
MNTVIQMHIDELDEKLLKSLRKLFKDKKVTITISDSGDETNYLLSSDSNRNHLLSSIEQVRENKFIQFKTIKDLENSLYDNKIN